MKVVYPIAQTPPSLSSAAMCNGKVAFETREAADLVMRAVFRRKDGLRGRGEAKTYRCAHCGAWHWGRTGTRPLASEAAE